MPELPLLRRELRSVFRSRSAFWLLVLVVTLACLVPLAQWPTAQEFQSGEALQVRLLFFETLLAMGLLVIPAIASTAIAGERERGTYELLCALPISPLGLALSKLLAPLAYLLMVLLATAPAGISIFFIGSVTLEGIVNLYVVIAVALTLAVPIGVAASLQSRSVAEAMLRGLVHVAFWSSGPFVVPWVFVLAGLQVRSIRRHALTFELSPAGLLDVFFCRLWAIAVSAWMMIEIFLLRSPSYSVFALLRSPFSILAGDGDIGNTIEYVLFASCLGLGYLVQVIRGVSRDDELPGKDSSSHRFATRLYDWRPSFTRDRALVTQLCIDLGHHDVALFRNPVFLREARVELGGSLKMRRWVVILNVALFFFWLTVAFNTSESRALGLAFTCCSGLILVVVPLVTALAISSELERANVDLLRATSLRPAEILGGKLLAGLEAGAGIYITAAWLAFFYLFARFAGGVAGVALAVEALNVVVGSALLAITALYAGCASILAALLARRSLGAIALAYLLTLGLGGAVPMASAAFFPGETAPAWLSPFTAQLAIPLAAGGRLEGLLCTAALGALALGAWWASLRRWVSYPDAATPY